LEILGVREESEDRKRGKREPGVAALWVILCDQQTIKGESKEIPKGKESMERWRTRPREIRGFFENNRRTMEEKWD